MDNLIPTGVIFSMDCWLLWSNRNAFVFSQTISRPPSLANLSLARAREFWYFACNLKSPGTTKIIEFKWEPPNLPFAKLNIDGSLWGSTGLAGGGGLIRNHHGIWIVGFSRNLGHTCSFSAEVWALRDDLKLAIENNITALAVEIDASEVVSMILNGVDEFHEPPCE